MKYGDITIFKTVVVGHRGCFNFEKKSHIWLPLRSYLRTKFSGKNRQSAAKLRLKTMFGDVASVRPLEFKHFNFGQITLWFSVPKLHHNGIIFHWDTPT